MEIFGLTDVGLVRKVNEDCILYGHLTDYTDYAVLCDGMGGANHGEFASRTAATRIRDNIKNIYRDDYSELSIKNLLQVSCNIANREVFSTAEDNPDFNGMGTTVCCAVIKPTGAYVMNVGDSRAYIYDGNRLKQITVDHSLVQDLVSSGEITKSEAKNHPKRNIITKAIGVEKTINGDFFVEDINPDDILLLCSDGLHGYVPEDKIIECLNCSSVEDSATRLIQEANAAGGKDNISVILIKY